MYASSNIEILEVLLVRGNLQQLLVILSNAKHLKVCLATLGPYAYYVLIQRMEYYHYVALSSAEFKGV